MPADPAQDQPDLAEILRTVREYLESIVDRVPSEDRYQAMCSVYLMAIAERELAAGAVAAAELEQRLQAFIGDVLPHAQATAELAARIRSGACDTGWDETFALVLAQVIHRVRVSRPEHLHAMHRRA